MEWNKTYGGTKGDSAQSLIVTSDGGYLLVGATNSNEDSLLVKTDAYGNVEWNKTYGGTEDQDIVYSVVETSDECYVLAGWTSSYGAGANDFWLIKTDSSGNMLWNRTYGGTETEVARSVVETSDGGYAILGEKDGDVWLIKTDETGEVELSETYGGAEIDYAGDLVLTSDGYVILGYNHGASQTNNGCWLTKTNELGEVEWTKTYTKRSHFPTYSLISTSDGGYAVGSENGDFWLLKTDSLGNEEWTMTYGLTRQSVACSLVETSDGKYVLAGTISGDIWVLKTE
jgi:hypothetical protein